MTVDRPFLPWNATGRRRNSRLEEDPDGFAVGGLDTGVRGRVWHPTAVVAGTASVLDKVVEAEMTLVHLAVRSHWQQSTRSHLASVGLAVPAPSASGDEGHGSSSCALDRGCIEGFAKSLSATDPGAELRQRSRKRQHHAGGRKKRRMCMGWAWAGSSDPAGSPDQPCRSEVFRDSSQINISNEQAGDMDR